MRGYNPEEYSGHSIRIGGCQSLFDVEVDLRIVACVGRWVMIRLTGHPPLPHRHPAGTLRVGQAGDRPTGGASYPGP